jgi:hypothetical protein
MLSTSTIEILKKLNSQELKKFGDFIKSPYFNTTTAHEKIYDIVTKAHPDYISEDLKSEAMSVKIFGEGEFKEKRLKNLCSEFGSLLRKFIGYEAIAIDTQELDLYTSKGFSLKHLFEESNKLISKSNKDHGADYLSLEDRFRYTFWLDLIKAENLSFSRQHTSKEFVQVLNEMSEKLVIYYYTTLLKISLADNSYQKILKAKEIGIIRAVRESTDMEKIIAYLKSTDNEYASFLKIHYLFFYYTDNDVSEEQYLELKNEILISVKNFSKIDKVNFIYKIVQMILTKIEPINQKYLNDVLQFTDLIRSLKIYPDKTLNGFADTIFRDVFKTAITLKEYQWAENFAEEFVNYLNTDLRETHLNFCKSVLGFHKGNYDESLKNLSAVKLLGISEKIDIRFYFLMNYIELKAYESAFSAITSFRQFLYDSKEVPDVYRPKIEPSLKYFNEIIRCEEQGKPIDKMLLDEAKNEKNFYQKIYILEKMEKLL